MRKHPNRRFFWNRSHWLVFALSLGACDPQARGAKSPTGSSGEVDQGQFVDTRPKPKAEPPAEDVVMQAGRHFKGYRVIDGLALDEIELFTYLAAADAICFGERHDVVLDHYAQVRAVQALADRRAMRGFELGVGLEMVQHEAQGSLSAYLQGEMERAEFLTNSLWEQSWGFPIQYYDPILIEAAQAYVFALALGVPQRITQKIALQGLSGLNESELRMVPNLDLSNVKHRELFNSMMQGHPLPDGASLDKFYEAQVTWDEAMALRGKNWLNEHRPLRKLLILAGVAHCHRTAIPERIERDSGLNVVNIMVSASSSYHPPGNDTQGLIEKGYDYQIFFE